MSLNRYARRTDANQADIIGALEQVGAEVWVTERPADLLVWHNGHWEVLETKIPKGRYTPKQLEERAKGLCKGIKTVRSPVEALKAIGALT